MSARIDPGRVAPAVEALVARIEGPASLPPDPAGALVPYVALVAEWNARTNLTGAKTPVDLAEILCVDALEAAAPALVPSGARLVDVGSGGGAPALPLALLRDDLTVVLVEPLRKRVAFLRTAVGSLGLAGRVRVVEGRVDVDDPRVPGGPFDVASSRATFAPGTWCQVGAALAPRVLVHLGAEPFEPPPGLPVRARRSYALPSTGAPRTLLALGE